ncbi:MFS transporter [Halopelagius longus]|nr:MFS transporter [Halopelagius longus]SDR17266.1 Transmembrane secretion effector [Halopelagius longus]
MREILSNTIFRKMLLGRIITNIGDSLYFIGAMWVVHELGGSPFFVGVALFLLQLPQTLQFLFGPLVDQWQLKRVFIGSQLLQGTVILIIPLAMLSETLSITLLLTIIPALSILNQVIYPAQNAALPLIVKDDQIVLANTLFSLSYRTSDIAFRALGGMIIAFFGTVTLFILDSVTFLITAMIFATISFPSKETNNANSEPANPVKKYKREISEGFGYVKRTALLYIVLCAIIGNFAFGISFALLPSFADLRGGAGIYGALLSALAAGMLLGSGIASLTDELPLGKTLIVLFSIGTVSWIGAFHTSSKEWMLVLFALAWVPIGTFSVFKQAMVQNTVPEGLLGRVSSTVQSASVIAYPVGALLGGALGELFGVISVLTISGLGFLGVVIMFAFQTRLRELPAPNQISKKEILFSKSD